MAVATSTALAVAGLALSVGGAVQQRNQAKDAARSQKKARQVDVKIQGLQAARERREQVRRARIARANIVSEAGASGTGDTSSAILGAGQTSTQAASNVSFLNQRLGLAQQRSRFSQDAASAAGKAATGQAISSVGQSLFSVSGGFSAFNPSSTAKAPPGIEPNRPDSSIFR